MTDFNGIWQCYLVLDVSTGLAHKKQICKPLFFKERLARARGWEAE